MVTLPLAWLVTVLTSIAAFALARNARVPFSARLFLCGFLVSIALIGTLLGARLSFDAGWAARVQPLVAVLVAPMAYLGFHSLTQDSGASWRRALLWNGVPVGLAQILILAPTGLSADVFVLGITGIYLFRTAKLLNCTADDFLHVPPHAMPILRAALIATLALLGMMVATDGLIVAAGLFAGDTFVLQFLNGAAGVFTMFIFVVALIGVPMALRSFGAEGNKARKPEAPSELDRQLLARLDTVVTEKQLFRDNDLTLARLARRLGVPARDVTNAANRVTGENLSRYINNFRIKHAQRMLRETDMSITDVMFDAGFVSKSSFNTEFRRIVGQTPSQFRAGKPGS